MTCVNERLAPQSRAAFGANALTQLLRLSLEPDSYFGVWRP